MISFTTPWLLAGLAAVAVPLILHLVARREPPLVAVPAVRYQEDTARRHPRRFQFQHWLLLVIRMALIAALVLAAAGPSTAGRGPGGHAPAALVLVVDNSLSSAAIVDGAPLLTKLQEPARQILARSGAADRIWLVTADGVPRSGDPGNLRGQVDALVAVPLRLDLGAALATARQLLETTPLPGEIILLTDLQASAVTAADGGQTTVGVPAGNPPVNRGIAGVETGPQPWTAGGRLAISVNGDSPAPAAMTVSADGRVVRQLLVPPGGSGSVALGALPPGWQLVTVDLDPDELRLDDAVQVGIRVAPAVAANWPSGSSYLADAAEVLVANGRLARGNELALDRLGSGPSVVFPPEDPSQLGALNRALLGRGSGWQFGERIALSAGVDSSALLGGASIALRHRLERRGGGPGDVLLTAAGEPWIVRTGNLILVGSRMEPAWTGLPLTAAFMPFMDLLVNRLARGEVARLTVAAGSPVSLPERVTAVSAAGRDERVEGGAPWVPPAPGVYWMLAGTDTIGVVEAGHDSRESELARLEPGRVQAVWPGAEITTPERAAELAFSRNARADLRGPLLWLALLLGLAELVLGGFGGRRS